MSFFSGLYLYQVVMLAAGVLIFIVTLILLVILTATGKEIGTRKKGKGLGAPSAKKKSACAPCFLSF
jgi:hypothetical protein